VTLRFMANKRRTSNISMSARLLVGFGLGLIFLTNPPRTLACVPTEDEVPRCVRVIARTSAQVILPSPPAVLPAPPPLASQQVKAASPASSPRGTSTADAFSISDSWQTVGPNGVGWWNLGYGRDAQILEVWLDSQMPDSLGLAVFAPDISDGLSASTKPTGRGSYNKFEPNHALKWRGQSPREGTWYALVTNSSQSAVPYRVGFQRTQVDRNCTSYWENVTVPWAGGSGGQVYWTLCR
jgi:hypothetical protein